ncbi:hypothetical protein [Larkinella terrae]|uniref:Uncharacterized protein n=1 Tax=Larkinella terrae TaxID=2025311 RepID=A0A7K0EII3_9BACT|nr:hypothetical protein [Larkinella terrae]MRS61653.1 hypothetical protein [Larkinella terrae]
MDEQDLLDHIALVEGWTVNEQGRFYTWPLRDFHFATVTEHEGRRKYSIHNGNMDRNPEWVSVVYFKTNSFDWFQDAWQDIRNMEQHQYEATF